jgi:hypothetical protein
MLTGWGAPLAPAQALPEDDGPTIRDIVELARQERARRAAIGAARENRVFTMANVESYVPPAAETPAAETNAAAEAAADATGATAGEGTEIEAISDADQAPETTPEAEWLAWQEMVIELRNEIQILDDRSVDLQLQMTGIRGTVTAPTGTLQDRNRALADLAVAQSDLDETNAALEAAAVQLEALLANEPPRPE